MEKNERSFKKRRIACLRFNKLIRNRRECREKRSQFVSEEI